MKANTAIAIVAAPIVLLVAVILEGGNPMGLFNIPALVVVLGGTMRRRSPSRSSWRCRSSRSSR
jgi:flagellar motor component MotA